MMTLPRDWFVNAAPFLKLLTDTPDLEHGEAIEAHGAVLRQLQAWLKEKDAGFGGLVRAPKCLGTKILRTGKTRPIGAKFDANGSVFRLIKRLEELIGRLSGTAQQFYKRYLQNISVIVN